jgi:uncharacterized membrane protein
MKQETTPVGFARRSSRAPERWGALIAGGALALYGLTRRSRAGVALAALGGGLAYAGARPDALTREMTAYSSVLVNVRPEEAYRFWHDFEELSRFMRHVATVTKIGDRRSRWIAAGPMGARIRWDADIVSERENEYIAWTSVPGSDVQVDGWVRFRPATANRGTLIAAKVVVKPLAGKAGVLAAKIFARDPHFLMRQDLRRLKALMETGEIPTIEGQTHGPRTLATGVARTLNPDEPIRGEASFVETIEARRRAS